MQSEFLFFLAMMVFFFVLWLAGGGPTKPISWSGPYITPITNVDQTQVGYGNGTWLSGVNVTGSLPGVKTQEIRSSLSSAQYQLGNLQIEAKKQALFSTPSPYRGMVRITGGNFSATDQDQEYVTIQVSSSAPQDYPITGWRLQSVSTDTSVRIGTGSALPTSGGVNETAPIVLHPGDQAYIVSGESPIGGSFRENMCTGYLGYSQSFSPALAQRCPTARDEFDHYFEGNPYKDTGCYQAVQNTSICKTPSDAGRISSYCLALIDKRLNYNGCVASHQYDAYFSTGTWRIFLGRTDITRTHKEKSEYGELWKSSRDGVRLLDENGLTVDLYTY